MTEFAGLRARKSNIKMCFIKGKLKFKTYKSCLDVTQLKNKISHLEKSKTNIDSLEKRS